MKKTLILLALAFSAGVARADTLAGIPGTNSMSATASRLVIIDGSLEWLISPSNLVAVQNTVLLPRTNLSGLYVQGTAATPGQVSLYETNGTFAQIFKAPDALTNNFTFIFPTNHQPAGQTNISWIQSGTTFSGTWVGDNAGSGSSGGGVSLQYKNTLKADTFTYGAAVWTNVPGLSVTITPSSNTNQVYLQGMISMVNNAAAGAVFRLVRVGNSITNAICIGDAGGASQPRATGSSGFASAYAMVNHAFFCMDSPATNGATVYAVQVMTTTAGQALSVNRNGDDTDTGFNPRTASTITAIEVKP